MHALAGAFMEAGIISPLSMVERLREALIPDSRTTSATCSMCVPPASAKEVVPDLIICRHASLALAATSSSVRLLSKGTRNLVQIIGNSSEIRPRRSCWHTWVCPSVRPGMTSFPLPSNTVIPWYLSSISFVSPTSSTMDWSTATAMCRGVE